MSIRDKFVYVTTKEQDQTCIGLTDKSGKYHGVVYKYGKVSFAKEEDADGNLPLRFEWDIIDSNGLPKELIDDDFFNLIGDVLYDILDQQLNDGNLQYVNTDN